MELNTPVYVDYEANKLQEEIVKASVCVKHTPHLGAIKSINIKKMGQDRLDTITHGKCHIQRGVSATYWKELNHPLMQNFRSGNLHVNLSGSQSIDIPFAAFLEPGSSETKLMLRHLPTIFKINSRR